MEVLKYSDLSYARILRQQFEVGQGRLVNIFTRAISLTPYTAGGRVVLDHHRSQVHNMAGQCLRRIHFAGPFPSHPAGASYLIKPIFKSRHDC